MTLILIASIFGLIAGAFFLGHKLGYEKANQESEAAFREIVLHTKQLREDIERLPTRDLRERVRGARRNGGGL